MCIDSRSDFRNWYYVPEDADEGSWVGLSTPPVEIVEDEKWMCMSCFQTNVSSEWTDCIMCHADRSLED